MTVKRTAISAIFFFFIVCREAGLSANSGLWLSLPDLVIGKPTFPTFEDSVKTPSKRSLDFCACVVYNFVRTIITLELSSQ